MWNGPAAGWGWGRVEVVEARSSLRRGGDEGQTGEEGFKDGSELSRAWCCHILRQEEPAWRDKGTFEVPVSHLRGEAEDRWLLRFGA